MTEHLTHEEMMMQVEYGTHLIPVRVFFEPRNQLAITVRPDMQIEARAPINSKMQQVKDKLNQKAGWMWRQLDYFEQFQPMQPPREYVGGETHVYLGRQYRLKINKSNQERVRLFGKFFEVDTAFPDDSGKVKALMVGWYRDHAKGLIRRRIEIYLPDVQRYGAKKPIVRVRKMKRRWGSYTTSGTLLFNLELVKAPIHCVDYVLVHELCHLVHPNHSPDFYQLLGMLMPDWPERKERLEKVVV